MSHYEFNITLVICLQLKDQTFLFDPLIGSDQVQPLRA